MTFKMNTVQPTRVSEGLVISMISFSIQSIVLPGRTLQTIWVILRETFSRLFVLWWWETGCRSLFVPVLTHAEWRIMMLFCHRVWTVRSKACCRGLLCRRPVISQPLLMPHKHNHRCHISRMGWIREIRQCICIREREEVGVIVTDGVCVIKSEKGKQEDRYSRRRMECVWVCVSLRSLCCASPCCHLRFMSASMCLTYKDEPAQRHSLLVSLSHHHNHHHTHTLCLMTGMHPHNLSLACRASLTHTHL